MRFGRENKDRNCFGNRKLRRAQGTVHREESYECLKCLEYLECLKKCSELSAQGAEQFFHILPKMSFLRKQESFEISISN